MTSLALIGTRCQRLAPACIFAHPSLSRIIIFNLWHCTLLRRGVTNNKAQRIDEEVCALAFVSRRVVAMFFAKKWFQIEREPTRPFCACPPACKQRPDGERCEKARRRCRSNSAVPSGADRISGALAASGRSWLSSVAGSRKNNKPQHLCSQPQPPVSSCSLPVPFAAGLFVSRSIVAHEFAKCRVIGALAH